MKFLLLFTIPCLAFGYPASNCNNKIYNSGIMNDLALLAESVSSQPFYSDIHGVCHTYKSVYEKDGSYDTRMRIYENEQNEKFVVFRPTQQNPTGTSIHAYRQMVPCSFITPNCNGLVLDRFQQAFISLVSGTDSFWTPGSNIYISGHSLGASFSIMMGIYLAQDFQITPKMILNMAGPFFGDTVFNQAYLIPLAESLQENLVICESVNENNQGEFDGTIEGYNCGTQPDINILTNLICGVPIYKLPNSYGMHDLNNYREFFVGNGC